MKHWCGCETGKKNEVVYFIKICELHRRNNKAVWIALQHEDKKE